MQPNYKDGAIILKKNGSPQKYQFNFNRNYDGISLTAILDLAPGDKVISYITKLDVILNVTKVIFLLGLGRNTLPTLQFFKQTHNLYWLLITC